MSAKPAVIPFDRQKGTQSTPSPAPEAVRPTYRDLIKHHFGKLRVELIKGHGGQPVLDLIKSSPDVAINQNERNHLTALDDWMAEKRLARDNAVGPEFGDGFEEALERHDYYLRNKKRMSQGQTVRGLSPDTIRNRRSLLHRWRESSADLSREADLPKTIPEALRHLAQALGESLGALARGAGVSEDNVWSWASGHRQPEARSIPEIQKIERYCSLRPGALVSLMKGVRAKARVEGVATTAYGERQRRAIYETYRINDLPPRAQTEWDELYDLKTPELTPDSHLKRNNSWHVDEDGNCRSGEKAKGFFASFYGYLCLPAGGRCFPITKKSEGEFVVIGKSVLKGKGLSVDDLTMALVTDASLVRSYIEFMRRRCGSYTDETLNVLQFCLSLLRPTTGFVRQHPEYGQRLSPPVPAGEWDARCDAARRQYEELRKELRGQNLIRPSRPAEEPIQHILDRQHPITALFELADAMEADLPSASAKVMRAVHYRDVFLVRFLTSNPLRIRHFQKMMWRPDNTGNLYQTESGEWRLRYPKTFFKNRKFLNKDKRTEYNVALPPSLWPYVETYLFEHRQYLADATTCDYVFRPRLGSVSLCREVEPITRCAFALVLSGHARRYLHCIGFGPHAYRHIVATEYIKNHLNGFEVAASILNDKAETVRKQYAHLEHADYYRHWLTYHDEQQENFRRDVQQRLRKGKLQESREDDA